MIKTLVFATDLCVCTPYLVQHVVTLAQRLRANIVVVHAVEPLGSLGTAMVNTFLPADSSREFQQRGMHVLAKTIKERVVDMFADEFVDNNLALGQVEEVVVEPGKPAEIILKHAKRTRADLIVMGSRGPEEDEAASSIGSVTQKVLQLARVPVYTIPMLRQTWNESPQSQQVSI